MKRQVVTTIAILTIAVSGCISATDPHKKAKQGAAVGAASGAVLGAVVGNQSDSTGEGAAIGAAVGAGIGTAIGWHMDKQQAELEQVPGIEVTRPSEGEIAVTINNDILYDVDSSMLRAGSRSTLNEMAGVFSKYPDTMIELSGHADSTGTIEHNQLLSAQRAQAVGNYLVRQGVSSSRIDTIGYGESEPVETNATAQGRQANRRVEIKIKADQQ